VTKRGRIVALALVCASLLTVVIALRPFGMAAGNRLVVVNAGSAALDSVVVESEPPGANILAGHAGAVGPRDSLWLALPRARGDADADLSARGGGPPRGLLRRVLVFEAGRSRPARPLPAHRRLSPPSRIIDALGWRNG
jgi:hypothetical protein